MSNKPTEAQIKEFWEKYDCLEIKQFPTTHPLLGSGDVVYVDAYVWKPTGQRLGHQIGACEFPPIDLNNLFKYVVPKAHSKLGDEDFYSLLKGWSRAIIFGRDPALALFWALWQVKEEK